jgi:hypothetical protein
MYSLDNVDAKVHYFNETVAALLDTYLPLYTITCCVNDKPWVTAEFRHQIRARQYAWSIGDHTSYNKLRNRVNRLTKKLRAQYYNKLVKKLHTQDPRLWWRGVNKLTGRVTRSGLQPLIDSAANSDVQLFADLVNQTLCEVSQDLKPLSQVPIEHWVKKNESATNSIDYSITALEVFNSLSRIDVHKSPGPDNLPNWVLREYAFAISEPICHIFNYSLQNGVMPDIWKAANVVPIPKSHPPASVQDDLRPISLTPTLSKVLERLIGKRMLPCISAKFDHRQYGALKGRSTTHALIDITHMCHLALDNRQSVRCAFIDFRKAFDHVDHETVLRKMSEWNIDTSLLRWMHSYLYNRHQRVKVGDITSSWLSPNGGMPQGSFFGPYVFLILINDLLTTVPLIKFVDDVTAVEIVRQGDASQMQSVIEQIAEWSDANLMSINTNKSKEMVLGPLLNENPANLALRTDTIQTVKSFKLLGVNISSDLRWNEHIDTTCSKASKRLHYLSLLKRSSLSEKELIHYYKTVVRPVLEYACPVWQSSLTSDQHERIEAVQRRALRIISGSKDYDLQCAIYDIEPLSIRLRNLSKSFFDRICQPSDCLHYLLPPSRPSNATEKLRHFNKLPLIQCRTERFRKSFIPYSLTNFQT